MNFSSSIAVAPTDGNACVRFFFKKITRFYVVFAVFLCPYMERDREKDREERASQTRTHMHARAHTHDTQTHVVCAHECCTDIPGSQGPLKPVCACVRVCVCACVYVCVCSHNILHVCMYVWIDR